MRVQLCAIVLAGGLMGPALAQQAQPPAIPVMTVRAEAREIGRPLDFVGRVDAINRVEVRARVQGYLQAVLFKEGALIQEGAPLYRIEKGQFEAEVQQAQGALERSHADLDLATLQLQRAEDLLTRNAGTAVARDQAKAAEQTARGNILTNEGNLQVAKINLGYTDITSPITGKIGRTNITKGNVVGPNSGVLTTIVSQDPMYVAFPVSQREFLRARESGQRVDVSNLEVSLRFADGKAYEHTGRINFIDVSVDRATDTVLARAEIPNPNGALIDGQLVRVNITSMTPEKKLVVPQAALLADQQGVYLYAVEDGKAVVKRVKPGAASGTVIAVDEGLSGGEQVIVDGLQGLRPGAPVQATPAPATLTRS